MTPINNMITPTAPLQKPQPPIPIPQSKMSERPKKKRTAPTTAIINESCNPHSTLTGLDMEKEIERPNIEDFTR